jgi:hypothetical protein
MAIVELQADVQEDDVSRMRSLAARRGLSEAEALQWAVQTADYLQNALDEGSKILIQRSDGKITELLLRGRGRK